MVGVDIWVGVGLIPFSLGISLDFAFKSGLKHKKGYPYHLLSHTLLTSSVSYNSCCFSNDAKLQEVERLFKP